MTEAEQRQAVCIEAVSWEATPYHHQGRIKGVGVDCAMLLCEVYAEVGLATRFDPRPYSPDWWMHRDEERFLWWCWQHTRGEVETPLPGDMVVYKFGRCFAHGGIVLAWPNIIHAYFRSRSCERALGDAGDLADRPRKFFTMWGLK